MLWLVMPSVGSCNSVPLVSSGTSAGSIAINLPVGVGPMARNKSDDVRVIQDALNQVTLKGAAGGTLPFLKVDGIIGPKTNAAISRFQQVQLQIFDGVIQPQKKTILRLNEIIDPLSDEDLRIKVRQAVPIVGQSIAAALLNLQAVINGDPVTNPLTVKAVDRLNRHFLLNTLSSDQQSTARVDLFRSYLNFQTVITRPELFNIEIFDEFDLEKKNPKFALVQPKGFFKVEEVDEKTNRKLDRIHLGLSFFAPSVTAEFAAFIILHELSHFVARSDKVDIEDHGRGWFNDIFITPLPAQKRLTNADCYASFAEECRNDSAAKPVFVKTAPGGLGGAR